MEITYLLNGKKTTSSIAADDTLFTELRRQGCCSVKCGCDTTNCGLCTVWLGDKPVLSCSVLAARIDGKAVTTLEGLQTEAGEFAQYMAEEGSDQCGYCNPGFIMNVLAMARELNNPSDEEINEYLDGNYCRCTGYVGQLRAIKKYLASRKKVTV